MKKVLSVALALVMLFAVCVPAFASQTITQPGDTPVEVMTLTTDVNGNPAANFTVTIPATVSIPWYGTHGGDFIKWSYTAQLNIGEQLQISLDKTSGEFYSDGENVLAYTLWGDAAEAAYVTTDEVESASRSTAVTVTGWEDVPVGAYSDTVTFTVQVV